MDGWSAAAPSPDSDGRSAVAQGLDQVGHLAGPEQAAHQQGAGDGDDQDQQQPEGGGQGMFQPSPDEVWSGMISGWAG
jgi:hypothetical protein